MRRAQIERERERERDAFFCSELKFIIRRRIKFYYSKIVNVHHLLCEREHGVEALNFSWLQSTWYHVITTHKSERGPNGECLAKTLALGRRTIQIRLLIAPRRASLSIRQNHPSGGAIDWFRTLTCNHRAATARMLKHSRRRELHFERTASKACNDILCAALFPHVCARRVLITPSRPNCIIFARALDYRLSRAHLSPNEFAHMTFLKSIIMFIVELKNIGK